MVYIFLANGFEETEALVTVDILRRASLPVTTVGIGGNMITGSHGIEVITDIADTQPEMAKATALVLPGGMPGTTNLEASPIVQAALEQAVKKGIPIAAICAAPSILGHKHLLKNKRATVFPGFENALVDAIVTGNAVETDGNYITAKGAGVVMEFAFTIVEKLTSADIAKTVKEAMQCR